MAVIGLAAAAVLAWRNFRALNVGGSEADSKLTAWLCVNPECKNEFELPLWKSRKLRAAAGDASGPLECPKCHQITGEQAVDCPSCGRYAQPVHMGMFPAVCPYCGVRTRPDDAHMKADPSAPHK